MNEFAILSLEYLEPDYKDTISCLMQNHGADIYFASRDGVGNMSRAFNEAFTRYKLAEKYKAVWFITNIIFTPEVPAKLFQAMISGQFAAVHPACSTSDHQHLRPHDIGLREVPFVELMAPMIDTRTFKNAGGFQTELWYWYMDLQISWVIHQMGRKLACLDDARVEHTYLRNSRPHPITTIRKELREVMREHGQAWLRKTHGPNWRQVLGWKE